MSLMESTASHSNHFGEETSNFFCLGQGWRLTICLAFWGDRPLGNPQLCLLTFNYVLFSALHLSSKVCYMLCFLPFQASCSKLAASYSAVLSLSTPTFLLSELGELSFPVLHDPASLFLIACFSIYKKYFFISILMRSRETRQDYEFNQSSHNRKPSQSF